MNHLRPATDIYGFIQQPSDTLTIPIIRIKNLIEAEGERWLEQYMQDQETAFRSRAFMLAELEQSRVESYKKYSDGKISQQAMENENRSFRDFVEKQEKEFQRCSQNIERKKKAISAVNPWVNLFLTWDEEKEFDRETLVKYIASVTLDHMEIDNIELVDEEWYWELPEEWRE